MCAGEKSCSPVQQEHRDFRSEGGNVRNAESCKALSVSTRPRRESDRPICPAPSTPTVRMPCEIGAAILRNVGREFVSGGECGGRRETRFHMIRHPGSSLMIRQLPPGFRSLYRLVLRTSSASVLHARPAAPRLRAAWRPIFDVAAQMVRKAEHHSPNTDEAGAATQARQWLNIWEKQSTSVNPCTQSDRSQKTLNSG